MARKKRTHKKMSGVRRHKRHSLHGSNKFDTQNLLGLVAGAVIAGYINKVIPATTNDKIVSGGKIALGLALQKFMKGSLTHGIGSGMIAVGSVDLLKSFGALSGDFDIPVINGDVLAGDVLAGDDLPVINGDDLDVINGDDIDLGMDDDLSGDDDMMMSGDDE
jgi:hypothetical protein